MAISLKDIAARAGTYPSLASRFGKTLAKLAESMVAHPSEKLRQEASAPASPVDGDIYFNTTDKKIYVRDGGAWVATAALV